MFFFEYLNTQCLMILIMNSYEIIEYIFSDAFWKSQVCTFLGVIFHLTMLKDFLSITTLSLAVML